jgi:hypothetical protein
MAILVRRCLFARALTRTLLALYCQLIPLFQMSAPAVDPVEAARALRFAAPIDQENFLSSTGVSAAVFAEFFGKYSAACSTPGQLFRVLALLKLYPVKRSFGQVVGADGGRGSGYTFHRVKEPIRRIAGVVRELSTDRLTDRSNRLPAGLFADARGVVDTVPLYVRAHKSKTLSKMLCTGKYKDTVLKFEVITDLQGVPVWYAGPFEVRAWWRACVCAATVTVPLPSRASTSR